MRYLHEVNPARQAGRMGQVVGIRTGGCLTASGGRVMSGLEAGRAPFACARSMALARRRMATSAERGRASRPHAGTH